MTDRPIIFSAEMIRALLAGRKTMTRRMLYAERKIGNGRADKATFYQSYSPPFPWNALTYWTLSGWHKAQPGDRLWVRENWKPHSLYQGWKPRDVPQSKVFYMADNGYAPSNGPWVPCIHMPRWASRLTLEVVTVKIERLNDISEDDAAAEGALVYEGPVDRNFVACTPSRRMGFAAIWLKLNGPQSLQDNPWVVALTFKVHTSNIDAMERAA